MKKELKTIEYHAVVGFVFSSDKKQVLLIEKKRPNWQKGKLNGPGGKIKPDESALQAMNREWKEETIYVPETVFERFAILTGKYNDNKHFQVSFFRAFGFYKVDHRAVTNDEIVDLYDVDDLPPNLIPNLRYLIPMALVAGFEDRCRRFNIFENY